MKLTKMKKTLGLILLIGIVVIGITLFMKGKLPAEQESHFTLPSASEIDTSNWKTYRNEEFGFEFKYPEEYEVWTDYDPHGGRGHLLGGFVRIGASNVILAFDPQIFPDDTLEEMAQYLSAGEYGKENIKDKELIYVGGEKAIKVKVLENGIYREAIYFRGKSKKVNIDYSHGKEEWKYTWCYIFTYKEDPNGVPKAVFDQIVASFEFIE